MLYYFYLYFSFLNLYFSYQYCGEVGHLHHWWFWQCSGTGCRSDYWTKARVEQWDSAGVSQRSHVRFHQEWALVAFTIPATMIPWKPSRSSPSRWLAFPWRTSQPQVRAGLRFRLRRCLSTSFPAYNNHQGHMPSTRCTTRHEAVLSWEIERWIEVSRRSLSRNTLIDLQWTIAREPCGSLAETTALQWPAKTSGGIL